VLQQHSEIEVPPRPATQTLQPAEIVITDQIMLLNEESEGKRPNIDIDSSLPHVKGIMVQGHEISGIKADDDNYSSFARLLNNQNYMSSVTQPHRNKSPGQKGYLPSLANIDVA